VNSSQFPEAFKSLATGLGAPKRYFPVKNLNRAGSMVAFIIFIGGSILVFLYGLYVTYVAYQKHGPAVIDDKLTVPVIIALVLLLLGLAAGTYAYVNWSKGVMVYDRGFAVRDRKGIRIWRWEDIVSLTESVTRHYYFRGIYSGTTHLYNLFNLQNQRLVLSDIFTDVEEIALTIRESIFPILYDRAVQQYNAGQMLSFGSVMISKAGIEIGKKTYPWTEIQQVSIKQGVFKVSKKSGDRFSGASTSTSYLPNLNVLLNIINQVAGLKVG
jgi:hypothetical protein